MKKYKLLITIIRISLILAILGSIYERNWINIFLGFLTLILTFAPSFISKKYKIYLPIFLQFFIVAFIYAGLFLGEIHNFYFRFWWLDSVLHLLSGIALGFVGFLIIYILYKTDRFRAEPILIAIFAFSFAMSLGGVWEIFEFLMDEFLNTNMQKARDLCCGSRVGVIDTMMDLILDAIGAIIASIVGYLLIKGKNVYFFGNIVKDFEEHNERLFKR